MDYLTSHGLSLPEFIIADSDNAETMLEDMDLNWEMDKNRMLVTFQLPKQLAHHWWKGGAKEWGEGSEDVGGKAIEWGHFYRKLMPLVWEKLGFYEHEKGMDFRRINPIGQHDPDKYYYVWEVGEADWADWDDWDEQDRDDEDRQFAEDSID